MCWMGLGWTLFLLQPCWEGCPETTARGWYASLNAKAWSKAFSPGKSHIKLAVGNSGTELAVGNPETDLTALPDTLPVAVDVAETSSESDCDLDSFVPKLTRNKLEIWREHSNFARGLVWCQLNQLPPAVGRGMHKGWKMAPADGVCKFPPAVGRGMHGG